MFFRSDLPYEPDSLGTVLVGKKLNMKDLYRPKGMAFSDWHKEAESSEYAACQYRLNDLRVLFRTAKITPTKIGQFVTIWKRFKNGPIQPYDVADSIDLFVIAVRNDENFGHFVFPKDMLCQRDIVSKNGKGGKRGIRVYPPWDIPTSKQAEKTQDWQLEYFVR